MPAKPRVVWEGSPSLRRLLVPTDSVVPHPDNPRRGNLDVIEESLRTFGQVRPILVNKRTGYIVAGNHTYRALTERLGWNRVARVVAELDDEAERKYLLMDNRSSDVGSYDVEALDALLASLVGDGEAAEAIAATGYAVEDYERIRADAAMLFNPPVEDEPPPRLDRREARVIELEFNGDNAARFLRFVGMLSKEWGTKTLSEVVYKCVETAAKNL